MKGVEKDKVVIISPCFSDFQIITVILLEISSNKNNTSMCEQNRTVDKMSISKH